MSNRTKYVLLVSHHGRRAQVMAAVRDGRGGVQRPAAVENGAFGQPPSPAANGTSTVVAEGAEATLLYVRFRATAEPGLKGLSVRPTGCAHVTGTPLSQCTCIEIHPCSTHK
jgi:hypothetical protein